MIVVGDKNEDVELINRIVHKTKDKIKWGTLMGRYVCDCGWSAINDWPVGGGYSDYTPWLVFKNHVKEKHGLDVKVFT